MIKKLGNNKVVNNFSFLTIGNTIAQFFNLFILIKIARIVSTEEYGQFTFLIVQAMLLATIVDFGTRSIIIRTIARDKYRTRDLFINGIIFRVILSVIFSLIYYVYNYHLGNLNLNDLISITLFACAYSIGILFDSIFYAHEKMLPTSIINISINIFWLLLLFLTPDSLNNVSFLFYLFVASNILKPIVLSFLLYYFKLIKGKLEKFKISTKNILLESWPYLVTMLLMLPVNYLSNNFLDIFSNPSEVGYFNLAQKITSPFFMIIGFALAALFPNLSILWSQDQIKFKIKIVNGIKYFMILLAFLSFFFTLFASELITLTFTNKYINAVKVSQTQIWFVLLLGMNSFIGTIWGSCNKEKLLIKTTIVNAVIATPVLLFGSHYGALGLSFGYVLSFSVFEIYLWIIFVKSLGLPAHFGLKYWILIVLLFLTSYYVLASMCFVIKIIILISILVLGVCFYKKLFSNVKI
jgi:O-antigen/teichoic acid export membrane protein